MINRRGFLKYVPLSLLGLFIKKEEKPEEEMVIKEIRYDIGDKFVEKKEGYITVQSIFRKGKM